MLRTYVDNALLTYVCMYVAITNITTTNVQATKQQLQN